jgi:hypothetical protein
MATAPRKDKEALAEADQGVQIKVCSVSYAHE